MPAPAEPPRASTALANELRPILVRVARELRKETSHLGITGGQATLLWQVAENPGIGLRALAELEGIAARLILTKADLAEPAELEAVPALYRSLGYETLVTNPKAHEGIDAIEREFASAHTLLIGQSGVGKSSLFRALGGVAAVGDVSKGGRGKQTTSTGRLHRFADGFLIDSPGVGEFTLEGVGAAELSLGFVEFALLAGKCRFADCIHRSEPGCAILAAVAAGGIASSRYASYRSILERAPG